MQGFTKGKNVMTKVELTTLNTIAIPAMSAQVWELR
jgi:hypothetical protein